MKLLDIVVLLKAVPEKRLNKGQVGTIVEKEKELMQIFFEPLAA
jgi:hypothetical protein